MREDQPSTVSRRKVSLGDATDVVASPREQPG
jgi:hypothetical protein